MAKNVVHAKIEDAITHKREILESATNAIQLLQQFEKLKKIKEGKAKAQEEFIGVIERISNLITRLETKDLPEIEIEEEIPEEVTAPKGLTKRVIKPKEEKKKLAKELTTTEKLDKELKDIQEKISSLEI